MFSHFKTNQFCFISRMHWKLNHLSVFHWLASRWTNMQKLLFQFLKTYFHTKIIISQYYKKSITKIFFHFLIKLYQEWNEARTHDWLSTRFDCAGGHKIMSWFLQMLPFFISSAKPFKVEISLHLSIFHSAIMSSASESDAITLDPALMSFSSFDWPK